MAEYTIELKDVIAAGHNIFAFKYPFYDENKRPDFEQKFIRHFYFREIGAETIDRFIVYLEDKMNTVFPYYNALFETALIEYDKVNNYDLTETHTIHRENKGKSDGVSSTVGQTFSTQETESNQNKTVDTEGNANTTGKDTETETVNTTTENEGNSTTTDKTTVSGTTEKTTNDTVTGSKATTKKFLDTPQGLTDLTNSKYLTTLEQVNDTENQTRNGTENTSNEQTTNGNSSTDTENTGETNTTRNGEKNSTVNQDTTGKETTVDSVKGSVTDEQKTTHDNNTRLRTEGVEKETLELKRYGNIGIQTASDMLTKHIELQKVLSNIEKLFFAECEDLFMLVY